MRSLLVRNLGDRNTVCAYKQPFCVLFLSFLEGWYVVLLRLTDLLLILSLVDYLFGQFLGTEPLSAKWIYLVIFISDLTVV